jgi:hypothetical protein
MNDDEGALVIHWFEFLEARLLDFVRHVPPVGVNLQTHSYELAGVITDACGVLDSLFLRVANDRGLEPSKGKNFDMTDWARLFGMESPPALASATSLLLIAPARRTTPYEKWQSLATDGPYEPTSWWAANNDLKHDRITHADKATLRNALDSMCALHQAIARLPEMAASTMRHGWIHSTGWNPEMVVKGIITGKGFSETEAIVVETRLFAVPVGSPFPEDLTLICVPFFICSERMRRIVGARW